MRAATLGRRRAVDLPASLKSVLIGRYIAGVGQVASSGRLVSLTDLTGNGNTLLPPTAGAAPFIATDYLGRPVLRYDNQSVNGGANATLAAATHAWNGQQVAAFLICRPKTENYNPFSIPAGTGNGSPLLKVQTFPTASSPYQLWAQGNQPSPAVKVQENPGLIGVTSVSGSLKVYTQLQTSNGMGGAFANTYTGAAVLGAGSLDVYESFITEATLTAQNIADIRAYAAAKYGVRNSAFTKNVAFEGDSITYGSAVGLSKQYAMTGYPEQVLRVGVEDWKYANLGVSGASIGSLSARATAADAFYDASCAKNVFIGLIGRNDVTVSDNSATIYSSIVTYVQARVAAGWQVWWGTALISGGGLAPTIQALNAKLKGTPLGGTGNGLIADAGATRILDFYNLPNLLDPTNTTYFQGDNTHPTPLGAKDMADLVAPLLAAA